MRKERIGSTLESLFDELGEREEFDRLVQKKLESAQPCPICGGAMAFEMRAEVLPTLAWWCTKCEDARGSGGQETKCPPTRARN